LLNRRLYRLGVERRKWVEEDVVVRSAGEDGEGSDTGLCLVHSSIELCGAAEGAISRAPGSGEDALDGDEQTETPMQHFHAGNLEKIKDAPPNTWATVNRRDVLTLSELARRGFHLVDMSGEVWTVHRAG
jgi:hypothetical protein